MQRNNIGSILGLPFTCDLGRYLGVPLAVGRVTRASFEHILEKMRSRLAGWKTQFLNLAGRTTLAQSTLSTIPLYSMQSSWLPSGVCNDVDKLVRGFLWANGSGTNGLHLVAWNEVTKPKASGGLGIRTARANNAAMLGKLGWEIVSGKSKLWVQVCQHKYLKGKSLWDHIPLASCSYARCSEQF